MKGVVMLVNYFPPLPTGGAERQAERLAAYLATQNVSTGVLTRKEGDLPAYEKREGYNIYRLSQVGPGKMKTLTFTLSAMLWLLRQKNAYDILHAHLAFSPAVAAALSGKLLGKRVIVKFGNSGEFGDVQQSQKSWRGRLRLAILRRWADIIVTLDPQMEAEVISNGFNHRRVVQMDNGIDASAFKPRTEKYAAKQALGYSAAPLVLYIGRFSAQKALHVLLKAFKQAITTCPDLYLLLLGHGNERSSLTNLSQELGIDGQVNFCNPVNDVRPFLDAADIFVLPSQSEGISNSLLEAMSTGLACIATSVGGNPVMLQNGNCGMLVPPNSVDELAAALSILGASSDQRAQLGIKARQRILDRYDFKVVGQKYYDLYQNILEN